MARKDAARTRGLGRLIGAAKAVQRMFTRGHDTQEESSSSSATPAQTRVAKTTTETQPERIREFRTDIPLDLLEHAYTPADTSSKAAFRSSGQDHHDDQEFATGMADERWSDEDRLTNRSGDPRIGTHGRTYEPEEARAGSRE
jgi:hypothetical protein